MTEIQKAQPLSIDHLRRGVKAQLHQLDPGLRVIAENIMGLASPIDLVTVNDHGDVVLMLLALEGESDATLLTRSLAQRAWIAARVGHRPIGPVHRCASRTPFGSPTGNRRLQRPFEPRAATRLGQGIHRTGNRPATTRLPEQSERQRPRAQIRYRGSPGRVEAVTSAEGSAPGPLLTPSSVPSGSYVFF